MIHFDNILSNQTRKARVISVYDGDTFKCRMKLFNGWFKDKYIFTIRMLGINAPEIPRKKVEQLLDNPGIISGAQLRNKILGKKIKLVFPNKPKGKFGRMLATVYYDGENINQWMIEHGYAVKY